MQNTRTHYYEGSPEDIGISIGKLMGNRLSENINSMLSTFDQSKGLNYVKLENESMTWLETLPADYQKELIGIAKGAGCPIEKIAQCYYSSECTDRGCTSFSCGKQGQLGKDLLELVGDTMPSREPFHLSI